MDVVQPKSASFSLDPADWARIGWFSGNAVISGIAGLAIEVLPRLADHDWGVAAPLVTAFVFLALDLSKRIRFNWPMPGADWAGFLNNVMVTGAGLVMVYIPLLQKVDLGTWGPLLVMAIPWIQYVIKRYLQDNKLVPTPDAPAPVPTPDLNVMGLAFVAVMLCGSVAMAQPKPEPYTEPATPKAGKPTAIITGPTRAIPGDIAILDGSTSLNAVNYEWRAWHPSKANLIQPWPDKMRASVATYPGQWMYLLVVSNPDGIDIATTTLTVEGTAPAPAPVPPGPMPDPQPTPPTPPAPVPTPPAPQPIVPTPPVPTPLPDGKFGLAKLALGWASAVDSPDRKREATELADGCEAIAAQIAAGALTSDAEIAGEAKAKMQQVLAAHFDQWKTAFGDPFTARLKELYWASKLKQTTDWIALFRETAAGLRAVR